MGSDQGETEERRGVEEKEQTVRSFELVFNEEGLAEIIGLVDGGGVVDGVVAPLGDEGGEEIVGEADQTTTAGKDERDGGRMKEEHDSSGTT